MAGGCAGTPEGNPRSCRPRLYSSRASLRAVARPHQHRGADAPGRSRGRISGEKPADLPVQQVTKVELPRPQGRQGARAHRPAHAAWPRRQGDRISVQAFVAVQIDNRREDRFGSKREFPHFGLTSASSTSSGHWVANASAALCQKLPRAGAAKGRSVRLARRHWQRQSRRPHLQAAGRRVDVAVRACFSSLSLRWRWGRATYPRRA